MHEERSSNSNPDAKGGNHAEELLGGDVLDEEVPEPRQDLPVVRRRRLGVRGLLLPAAEAGHHADLEPADRRPLLAGPRLDRRADESHRTKPMDTPTTADWQSRTRGNVALHVVALIGLAALCCWASAGFPGYLT